MVKKRRGRSAAFMRSINPYLRASKRGSNNVARRSRRRSRRFFGSRRSSRRSSGGSKMNWLAALAYGVLRAPIANQVAPLVGKAGIVPAQLTDEVGMYGVDWAASRYGSGFIRDIGNAGKIIEMARAGETLLGGVLNTQTTAVASTNIF